VLGDVVAGSTWMGCVKYVGTSIPPKMIWSEYKPAYVKLTETLKMPGPAVSSVKVARTYVDAEVKSIKKSLPIA